MNIIKILEKNENIENGSFMYQLHEDNCFDGTLFLKYCEAICLASQNEHYKKFYPQIITNMSYLQAFIITHLENLNKNPKDWKVVYYGEGIKNYKNMSLQFSNVGWCCYEIIAKLSVKNQNPINLKDLYEILESK